MTDVPHIAAVLASLWFALRRRWLPAAMLAAIAESIRIESWVLLIALPALQWICDRRLSLGVIGILLLPVIAWLGIAYAATGDPLAYFADRARYHTEYINFHPERQGFKWSVISGDAQYFWLGTGKVISIGVVTAAVVVLIRWLS